MRILTITLLALLVLLPKLASSVEQSEGGNNLIKQFNLDSTIPTVQWTTSVDRIRSQDKIAQRQGMAELIVWKNKTAKELSGTEEKEKVEARQVRNQIISSLEGIMQKETLRKKNPGAMSAAIYLLGEYGSTNSVGILLDCLGFHDPDFFDPEVDPWSGNPYAVERRLPVPRALIKTGPNILPPVMQYAIDTADRSLSDLCARIMLTIDSQRAEADLRKLLDTEKNEERRKRIQRLINFLEQSTKSQKP